MEERSKSNNNVEEHVAASGSAVEIIRSGQPPTFLYHVCSMCDCATMLVLREGSAKICSGAVPANRGISECDCKSLTDTTVAWLRHTLVMPVNAGTRAVPASQGHEPIQNRP